MAHTYQPRTFDLPELPGISEKQLTAHLGLYEGYVKHMGVFADQIRDLEAADSEKYAYAIAEVRRRLGFEFDGMRMHEYYFAQFEGGRHDPATDSTLSRAIDAAYGSHDAFVQHFTRVGMTRGIGWTVLYRDNDTLHTAWVGDHEFGQLAGLPIILAMDMWEHAYMVDYLPSEKKAYIDAFMHNLNWRIAEERHAAAQA